MTELDLGDVTFVSTFNEVAIFDFVDNKYTIQMQIHWHVNETKGQLQSSIQAFSRRVSLSISSNPKPLAASPGIAITHLLAI